MATRSPPVIPEIAKAYQNDPRTLLANSQLAAGTSTAPVAEGKYAYADGIARMLTGLAGTVLTKKQMDKYASEQTKTIADQQNIVKKLAEAGLVAAPPQAAPPGGPVAAPPQAAAAAAALGAPPPAQAAPGGPVAPPAPMPAALAPQAMGGGMKKPPFGSSPAVAGGSRNAPWIAPPEPETIPDAPAVVERPKAPESVKPTRSRLLQAAYETIMNGNPYLFARGMEMYEKGNSEQTELDEKAAERDQEFRKMGYNADLSDYTDSRSAARSDTYARRRDVEQRNFTASENFKSRVFQHGEGETERAFQAAENAKNRAAARINAAISAAGSGRGRPLSFTAAEKLAGHAAVLDNAERLKEGFKDKYVGHPIFGDARVALNKIIGGDKNMANWWQDYEAWKQQVRHDLYGASLTKNEKEAFEKYVVTPGTNPKIAADNIERQRAIAATGLARMSRSAAASYGIESVYEAIGRDPTKLNTTATLHAPTPGGGGATGKTGDPLVDKYLGSH